MNQHNDAYLKETHQYDDIINMPHHVSSTHPQMPLADRAAQFLPFSALSGYENHINEAARLTDERAEQSDDMKSLLDSRLQYIQENINQHPAVSITYFKPDERKSGGAYVLAEGTIKKVSEYERLIIMESGEKISINEIIDINIL